MAEQVAGDLSLSNQQMQGIADIVIKALTPKPSNPVSNADLGDGQEIDPDTGVVTYTDPVAETIDKCEADLIKTLPRGTCVYRSRNGSQMVNHTTESLNYLQDLKKNRKDFRTRSRL